jgi:hypothetical protein
MVKKPGLGRDKKEVEHLPGGHRAGASAEIDLY